MKKILYVSGSRADFELMRETLLHIDKNPNLELLIVITGMHLLESRGNTLDEVKKKGFPIAATVSMFDDNEHDMGLALGKCIQKLSPVFQQLRPDIVLIEGDRIEALATGIVAALLNIPVAHVSGGDVSKSIDDSIRHALTKFAHVHFPGTEESAERIKKMGEEHWRIHMVGTPMNTTTLSKEDLENELGFPIDNPLLVVQHPVTTESTEAPFQMKETMEAIKELGKQAIVVLPNTDSGGNDMIRVIQDYESNSIKVFKNLPGTVFSSLLHHASAIVGNSSAGIVEAPHFETPCVNVGIRQQGREQASNVLNVDHDKEKIKESITIALSNEFKEKLKGGDNPYKTAGVAERICKVLEGLEVNQQLLNKEMTY